MKLQELRTRAEETRRKAVALIDAAQTENRFLTDEEEARMQTLEAELTKWRGMIEQARRLEDDVRGQEPQPEVPTAPTAPIRSQPNAENRFASFGEQLMAVYRAASPDGRIDSRLATRASGMNETVQADGGFLVQQDFVAELLRRTYETGVLTSRVRRIPVSATANGIKINAVDENSRANGARWGGVQAFWQDEAEELIASRPKFREMTLSLKKLTGLCYTTDELLQDTSALESVIQQSFAEEFGFKMDDAILRGVGAGQPLGVLNSGSLIKVAKDENQADPITVQNIVNMWSRLWGRSRANSYWYVNQAIEPYLYTLRVGEQPVYIPAGGLSAAPYASLMGRPVVPLEQCSAVGDVGDILLGRPEPVPADRQGWHERRLQHPCPVPLRRGCVPVHLPRRRPADLEQAAAAVQGYKHAVAVCGDGEAIKEGMSWSFEPRTNPKSCNCRPRRRSRSPSPAPTSR